MYTYNCSNENYLIINVLFTNNIPNQNQIKLTDFDKLTVILSNHLIIPAFYSKSFKKKILKFYPKGFKEYIREIYIINKNRNNILKEEIHYLNSLFKKNNLNPIFIKGAAYILSEIYEDIGKRMIGDIDILFLDSEHDKANEILKGVGFKPTLKFNFNKNSRHLPRLKSNNFLFSVELHSRVLESKSYEYFKFDKIKNSIIFVNGFTILNNLNNLLINIYSFQINDFGYLKLSYSYKNLYDSYLLARELDNLEIDNNFLKSYFHIANNLDIKILKNKIFIPSNTFLFNFFLRKITGKLSYLYQIVIQKFFLKLKQINYFFSSDIYRNHVRKKIKKYLFQIFNVKN